MAASYGRLSAYLAGADRQVDQLRMTFAEVSSLVTDLPLSARKYRAWWRNHGGSQADVWRRAGWHVLHVDFDAAAVVFARGAVDDAGKRAGQPGGVSPRPARVASVPGPDMSGLPSSGVAGASVRLTWRRLCAVELSDDGVLTWTARLQDLPALYRFTLVTPDGRARVYVGEAQSLKDRMNGYRKPGPSQPTNQRMNVLLVEHLSAGGVVEFDVTFEAEVSFADTDGGPAGWQPLDLSGKAARLFTENAALLHLRMANETDSLNVW